METSTPLVVRGPSPARVGRQAGALMGALLLASVAGVVAARRGYLPWVDGAGLGAYPFLLSPLVALALWWTVVIPRLAAAGEATLDHDRVTLTKDPGGLSHSIPWSAVAGYRDRARAFVELRLVRGGDHRTTASIPTPTDDDRAAVLAFLDARGLRRVEG